MSQVSILVVDNDEGHIELVRRNLRRSGIDNPIIPLTNGKQALDYVFCRGEYATRSGKYDLLILLDINMPGTDGIEVLRQIKLDPKTKLIPVLMLTTTDNAREVARCYEHGCNVYITKPIEPSRFMDAIRQLGLFIAVINTPVVPAGAL